MLARGLGLVSAIGVAFAVLVSCGALAGNALDKRLGTSPWMLVLGVLLGIAAAFVNMARIVGYFRREVDGGG